MGIGVSDLDERQRVDGGPPDRQRRSLTPCRQGSVKPIIFNVSSSKAQDERVEHGMPDRPLPVLGGVQCEESYFG
jgi:hypothetical protein